MQNQTPAEDATAKAGDILQQIKAARAALIERTGDAKAYVVVFFGLLGEDFTFNACANHSGMTSKLSLTDAVHQHPEAPSAAARAQALRNEAAFILQKAEQLEASIQ